MSHFTPQHLSVAHLRGFGERFGISYDFPHQAGIADKTVVLRGRVDELPLFSGLHLTHSCLEVLQPYESQSTRDTALFLLVVLEGVVKLNLAGQNHTIQAGMGLTAYLDRRTPLYAFHEHQSSLRTLTIALNTSTQADTANTSDLLDSLYVPRVESMHRWRVPAHLYPILEHQKNGSALSGLQQRLLLEGLTLQLLAYGIEPPTDGGQTVLLSPQERLRLERIRQQLDQVPYIDYSVSQLAEQAAMSPSSFRHKFRCLFGQPVSEYARERRMSLAKQYLLQGYSVQQTAHFCGYRHASNFATAFRKHYGTNPGQLG
ncbi:MAG TPA: helix-turn-helix transcriptional regulator [Alcaligenes sp.]|nr:helix-turn-helix transcriptional regulator [Alcaligenes faecalis]HRL20309.1 helix-turn-helix transcriptional regulator [Alcaligenes sp.]